MSRVRFTTALIALFSGLLAAQAPTPPSPMGPLSRLTGLPLKDDAVRALIQESSGDRAHLHVQQLAMWDRDSQSSYLKASAWVRDAAVEAGLEGVRVEAMADEPQWRALQGVLSTRTPYASRVTSIADLPMSLAGGSSSFTGTGVAVVDIGSGSEDEFAGKDLKGKVVLTSAMPYEVFNRAVAKGGAVGILSSWTTPSWDASNRQEGEFRDIVGWAHVPSGDGVPKSFAFMISARKAEELRGMMREKRLLTVDVEVKTERVQGHYDIISGVIPGAVFPDEEIIITSHLDHYRPGADDNASGSAVSLEMARTLSCLIREGRFPRPLRTLRFIWMPEFSGTLAWFKAHGKEPAKRLANFNFDMLGADLEKVHSAFTINYTPDWQPSFVNALAGAALEFLNRYNAAAYPLRKDFQVISVNGSHLPMAGQMVRYTRGTDHQVFNDWGIPGIGFLTWPDDAYHSSGDTPGNLDATMLHRSAVAGLLCIVPTAYVGVPEADDLARLVAAYGRKRIADDALVAERRLLSAEAQDLPKALHLALASMQCAYRREQGAILSCAAFSMNRAEQVKLESDGMMKEGAGAARRLRDLATARSQQLGIPFKPYPLSDSELRARKRVPAWEPGKARSPYWMAARGGGEANQARVARVRAAMQAAEREILEGGEGELRVYQFEDALASYVDGQRSLLDIRDAVFSEYGIELTVESMEDLFETYRASGLMRF